MFGGITLFFVHAGEPAFGLRTVWASATLWALVMGQLTSYVKARAESLGFTVSGGLAARADRLLIILMGAWLAGLGVPYVLEFAVTALAVLSTITVFQRIFSVRRQARATSSRENADGSGAAGTASVRPGRSTGDTPPPDRAEPGQQAAGGRRSGGRKHSTRTRVRSSSHHGRARKRSAKRNGADASAADA